MKTEVADVEEDYLEMVSRSRGCCCCRRASCRGGGCIVASPVLGSVCFVVDIHFVFVVVLFLQLRFAPPSMQSAALAGGRARYRETSLVLLRLAAVSCPATYCSLPRLDHCKGLAELCLPTEYSSSAFRSLAEAAAKQTQATSAHRRTYAHGLNYPEVIDSVPLCLTGIIAALPLVAPHPHSSVYPFRWPAVPIYEKNTGPAVRVHLHVCRGVPACPSLRVHQQPVGVQAGPQPARQDQAATGMYYRTTCRQKHAAVHFFFFFWGRAVLPSTPCYLSCRRAVIRPFTLGLGSAFRWRLLLLLPLR